MPHIIRMLLVIVLRINRKPFRNMYCFNFGNLLPTGKLFSLYFNPRDRVCQPAACFLG